MEHITTAIEIEATIAKVQALWGTTEEDG